MAIPTPRATTLELSRTMLEKQTHNLCLLFTRTGASTAAATRRPNSKLQRRVASIGVMCDLLDEEITPRAPRRAGTSRLRGQGREGGQHARDACGISLRDRAEQHGEL